MTIEWVNYSVFKYIAMRIKDKSQKNTMLSERRQTKRSTYCIISFTCSLRADKSKL